MATKLVKQGELEHVLTLRLEQETLKRQLKRVETDLATAETLTIHAIDSGHATERGPLAAGINEVAGRVAPSWKSEFARVAGPDAVEQVIARTEPGPSSRKLVILRGGQLVKSALAGLVVALALWALPAEAGETCTPRYGGGYACQNFDTGRSTTITPRYGGGYSTWDSDGGSSTITPRYGGGYTIQRYGQPRQRWDTPYAPPRRRY